MLKELASISLIELCSDLGLKNHNVDKPTRTHASVQMSASPDFDALVASALLGLAATTATVSDMKIEEAGLDLESLQIQGVCHATPNDVSCLELVNEAENATAANVSNTPEHLPGPVEMPPEVALQNLEEFLLNDENF
jgi:hypothetical protein